jgi:hypothetical protein
MEDVEFIRQIRCMFVSQLGCGTPVEECGRFLPHGTQPYQRLGGELPLQPDTNSTLNSDLFYTNLKQIEEQLLFPSSDDFKSKSVNEKFRGMTINENLKQEDLICTPLKNEGSDLFDILGLEHRTRGFHGRSDTIYSIREVVSAGLPDNGVGPTISNSNEEDVSFGGLLAETDPDQLLDAIVSNFSARGKGIVVNTNRGGSCFSGATSPYGSGSVDCSTMKDKPMPESSSVKTERCETSDPKILDYKSQVSLWVENGGGGVIGPDSKRGDEMGKAGRKRSRPGENPRPRPKDRQLIQDRIKELREIVPNGEKVCLMDLFFKLLMFYYYFHFKLQIQNDACRNIVLYILNLGVVTLILVSYEQCSIDALLEKTIKHMLFLQSVAKHADKLKEAGESKVLEFYGPLFNEIILVNIKVAI